MKICRNLFHLITPLACFALAAAQADLAPGRILSLNLDPQSVTTLQLRPGFVTSVRLPEAVSSVVLGDPASFKAEHSETEPQAADSRSITRSHVDATKTPDSEDEIVLDADVLALLVQWKEQCPVTADR